MVAVSNVEDRLTGLALVACCTYSVAQQQAKCRQLCHKENFLYNPQPKLFAILHCCRWGLAYFKINNVYIRDKIFSRGLIVLYQWVQWVAACRSPIHAFRGRGFSPPPAPVYAPGCSAFILFKIHEAVFSMVSLVRSHFYSQIAMFN